jgi:cytochrome b561
MPINALLIHPLAVSLVVYNERLAAVLGLITLISALAVFFSCRTCLSVLTKIGLKRFVSGKGYRTFLKYHTYYWWFFWLIFVIHLLAAIMHLGFKNTSDPDAYLHVYSVIFGAAGLVALVVVSFSCRAIFGLTRLFSDRKPTDFKSIAGVYKYHAYYWLIFFLVIAVHFLVGFLHSGLWPSGV